MSSQASELINHFKKRFRTVKVLGKGSFGSVFEVVDKSDQIKKALKVQNNGDQYRSEKSLMEAINRNNLKGFPKIYEAQQVSEKESFILMSMQGPSLYDVLEQQKLKKFQIKIIATIAIQIVKIFIFIQASQIKILEQIHNLGYVHCDIKPNNILLQKGLSYHDMETLDNNIRTYCLIDFGLSHSFKDQYGNHHSMETTSAIFGNKNFMSLNHQEGYNQSRRDDLESLFYNLLYLSDGQFPWVTSKILDGQLTRSALYYKRNYNQEKIFKNMPYQFLECFKYIKSLGFEDKPSYKYIIERLLEVQKGESLMIASQTRQLITRDNFNNMESFRSNVRSFITPDNQQVVEENQRQAYPILNKESKTVRINKTLGKNSNFTIDNYDNLQIGTSPIEGLIIGTNHKPKSLFLKKRKDQTPKKKAPKKQDSFLQYIQNQEQELQQNLNLNISNQKVDIDQKQIDQEDQLTELDDQDFIEQSLDQNNIIQPTLIVQQIQEHSFLSRQMDLKLIKC